MSKSIKIATVLGLVVLASACAKKQEEVVVVAPAPVMAEPMSSKY